MRVQFHHREPVTSDIATFWFRPDRPFRYTAGQFIELRFDNIEGDARGNKRWFTLSSSPSEELLSITTRASTDSSPFKSHLMELKPGDPAEISQPMGDFVLPRDSHKPILFVVGGIGITPIRSMLTYLKDTGDKRQIKTLYAVRNELQVAFEDLVKSESDCRIYSRPNNPLTTESVKDAIADLDNPAVYISGPEPMVDQFVKELSKSLPQSQLITDAFPGYRPV